MSSLQLRRVDERLVIVLGDNDADWLLRAGNDASWATPKDQNVFFGDFSVAITKTL